MQVDNSKRKRSANSTVTSVSDFDSTLNTSENDATSTLEQPKTNDSRIGKQKAKKTKKAKTMSENSSTENSSSIETKLEEINNKLAEVLTKKDRSFIRDMIKDTVDEIKEQILGTVNRRLDALENDVHVNAVDNERLRSEIKKQAKINDSLQSENINLKNELKRNKSNFDENLNNLEQYGRRNNIRITGINDDVEKQQSDATTYIIVKKLNEKLKLNLTIADIDISHRIGPYKVGKHRPILAKFVHRQTKVNIMKVAKQLKGTNIYLNEDLTHINQEVLAAMRRNARDKIEHCWSFEGKLYARFIHEDKKVYMEQVPYIDYNYWLSYRAPPMPAKGKASKK